MTPRRKGCRMLEPVPGKGKGEAHVPTGVRASKYGTENQTGHFLPNKVKSRAEKNLGCQPHGRSVGGGNVCAGGGGSGVHPLPSLLSCDLTPMKFPASCPTLSV